MPQSRNRPKHHQQHHSAPVTHQGSHKTKRSAAFVVAVLAGILGLAVSYFTQGADPFWMIIGTASGAIIGYLVGRSMDRSIQKNN